MSKIYFDNTSDEIKDIIRKMVNESIGEEGENLSSLMTQLGITDFKKPLLWEAIINGLQNCTININSLGHLSPVRSTDIPLDGNNERLNTLIAIIEDFCDLPKDENYQGILERSKIYQKVIDDEDYWNESIKELAKEVLKLYEKAENTAIITIGEEKDITIETLENADAGNNFAEGNEISSQWVVPWWNIDGKNYDDVRWTDRVIDILKKSNKLQYTNNHSKWLTLLMPQYGRRVEIEDLDRNFWAITEVIDGISAWIFDDSPISNIIKKLIDETSQLWENLIYLWTQIALSSQKKNDEIRVISYVETSNGDSTVNPSKYVGLPLATAKINAEQEFEITRPKYYYFLNNRYLTSVYNNVKDFEKLYSDQNLCLLPITRLNNYHKNYYSGELYEKLIISRLSKTKDGDDYLIERKRKIYELYEDFGDGGYRKIVISPRFDMSEPTDDGVKRFSSHIYGSIFSDYQYFYGFPFSQSEAFFIDGNAIYLYGTLRIVPEIKFSKDNNGNETLNELNLIVYDAAAEVILKEKREIGRYSLDRIDENESRIYLTYTKTITDDQIGLSITKTGQLNSLSIEKCNAISSAYYLGEVASWRMRTSAMTEGQNIIEKDVVFLKLGDFLPANTTTFQTAFFKNGSSKLTTQIRGNTTAAENATGQLSFFLSDWSTYVPDFDIPNSTTVEHVCISKREKVAGKLLTEPYLAMKGMEAVKRYILNTKTSSIHPHRELWRKPCYFITVIGLTPWWGGTTNYEQMYWDMSMICHVYKYVPGPFSLKQQETIGNNYATFYGKNKAISFDDNNGVVIESSGKGIGSIISYHFINRYDSYYDGNAFTNAMLQGDCQRGDILKVNGGRAIKVIGGANEEEEYCNLIQVNDTNYIYEVNYSSDFDGIVQYYDMQRAVESGMINEFLDDYTIGNKFQVSEGKIKIKNISGVERSFLQVEEGAIRSAESGLSFIQRSRMSPEKRELNKNETNFLIQTGTNKQPMIYRNSKYQPLIYQEGLTPLSLFKAWTDGEAPIHRNVNYSFS